MDNKKYDDLDKLFQSRLKNDQIVKEEWNQPPQAAFEGALSVLDKQERKRRRRIFWWILGAVLLIGFVFITVFNFNRINHLESRIAAMQGKSKNLTSFSNNINENSTEQKIQSNTKGFSEENNEIANQNIQAQTKEKNNRNTISESIIVSNEKSIDNSNPFVIGKTPDKIQLQQVRSDAVVDNEIDNLKGIDEQGINPDQKIKTTEIIRQKNNYLSSIPFLPVVGQELINKNEYLIQAEAKLLPDLEEDVCELNPWKIYALAGVNASSIKMTNTDGADFSLTGYESYYADAFSGIGLDYQIHPKWNVNLQASYNKLKVKSTFEDEISYDKSLEIIDNQGNARYESDYDIYTVMGRQSGALSFALQNVNIDDQDQLMNQTQIDNSFETIGLSVATNYLLYCNGNWRIDVGIGVQYNHLLNLSEDMETSIIYENSIVLKETLQNNAMDYANLNYWSFLANMRFAYNFSEHSGLRLEMASAHSISSIRKSYNDLDSKTYINNLKASLQFYYSF